MRDNGQENENVDDVLAEMLERADAMQTYGTTHGVRLAIREFVIRIKTARKRELAKVEADALAVGGIVEAARRSTAEKSSAVGNAEAMREALVTAKKAICHHAEYVCRKLAWENGNTQSNCIIMLCAHRDLCEAKTAIQEALSAPARNCDRFADELDAQLAFLNEVWLISVDRETMLERDKYENWTDEMRKRYGKWLLAPAAERKGEDDA